MRWEWNLVLNNEMRWDEDEWYKNEALHLIMMMVKHCTKKNKNQIYLQKINKKIKTSIFFPSRLSSLDLVHVTFPEMEIQKLEHFFNY